jgi:hypothetical protein
MMDDRMSALERQSTYCAASSTRAVPKWKEVRHANMKELRFKASDGEWRVAFAFDPRRQAILLVAGHKSGGSQKRFYRQLIEGGQAVFGALGSPESPKEGEVRWAALLTR